MTPYASAAWDYWRADWKGVLPLPPGCKYPPPAGFTGHEGMWPFATDIFEWAESHADGNVALRLPPDMVGLDVDDHDGKRGGDTLRELEAEHGELPHTVMSTSRGDGVSGIRLFRAPAGPWPSQAGTHVDMIRSGHRYVVAWPSVHPSGQTYRWIDQRTGEVLEAPPNPEDIPELPEPWVQALRQQAGSPTTKAGVDDDAVRTWLAGLRSNGKSCDKVTAALEQALSDLNDGGSRHDTMVRGSGQLIGLGSWGHAGVKEAMNDLHGAFLQSVKGDGEGQRTEHEATAEWRRSVAGAVAMVAQDKPTPDRQCACPLPALTVDREEAFWTARPALAHVRQFARARLASPWATLGVVLVRVTTAMPPHYVLPPIIGGHASLNLFLGVVAASGGGKGVSEAVARDAIVMEDLHQTNVGSGEGIQDQYVVWVPPKGRGEDREPGKIEQFRDRVLFSVAEVDTLGALANRQSSTLLPELRKVWMGEELSFAYRDPAKRLKVDRHRYRAGLIVGIQPAKGGTLLDDADGGTPQRFLWLPATDPDMPDHAPDEPEPWRWQPPLRKPDHGLIPVSGLVELEVCQAAKQTIRDAHRAKMKGVGEALDGHSLLCREKVAAALAILDERLDVSEEDWQLAGVIMEKSDHTRDEVRRAVSAKYSVDNRARGHAEAEREEAADESRAHRVARKVSGWLRKLESESRSKLRRRLASTDRAYFDLAVERLVDAGQITVEETGNGTTYRSLETV